MISSNDLASRLGVSRATVLRAVAKGLVYPAVVTPGGHRRFAAAEVDRLRGLDNQVGSHGKLVGSGEAARLLGISQQTLNRAVREGRVHPAAVTPGGHRRFAPCDIVIAKLDAAPRGTR